MQSGRAGQALLNVLVAGYRVDALVAQRLKEATAAASFCSSRPAGVIASTLNPRATAAVVADARASAATEQVSDGVIEYALLRDAAARYRRQARSASSAFCGRSRPRGGASPACTRNIVLLWLAAPCPSGLVLTYLLARRIVEPVKQLDRAAAEVARQNYAIEVEVSSEDEMGRLARTFNTMCASIRQAREDLIRQERISTIGRLSGSIVHDLRNPLAAIYGGAEMLVDADLPPAHVKRLAGNIYRASRRIQELLQDLLNVSRGKTGAPEMCRLREVAAAACESLAAAAEAQGVTLALEIPPEIEAAAGAQPHGARLRQPDRQRAGSHAGRRRGAHLGGDARMARRWCTWKTTARGSRRRSARSCSSRSSARASATGWGWAWRSRARPCWSTAATCGWNRSPAAARDSASACPAPTSRSRRAGGGRNAGIGGLLESAGAVTTVES